MSRKKREQRAAAAAVPGGGSAPGGPRRPRRRRRIVVAAVAVAAVLVAGLVAFLALTGRLPGAGGKTEGQPDAATPVTQMDGGFRSVDVSQVQLPVGDEDEARDAVQEVAAALGIEDARDELGDASVSEVGGSSYYRFPQRSNGIPVYGRSVTVVADSGDVAASISGNTVSMPDASTDPSMSDAEVEDAVSTYLKDTYGADDVEVQDFSEDDLVYYTFDREEPALAYRLLVAYSAGEGVSASELVVSAEDGSVLLEQGLADDVTLPGNLGDVDVNVDDYSSDGNVPLQSTVEGTPEDGTTIYIYEPRDGTADEKFFWITETIGNDLTSGRRVPRADQVMANQTDNAGKQGVSSIASFTETLDYYRSELGRSSFDNQGADLYIFVDVTGYHTSSDPSQGSDESFQYNAAWIGGNNVFFMAAYGENAGDPNPYVGDTGVAGHEFTHAVASFTAEFIGEMNGQPTTANSINEGIADIIGVAVRASDGTRGDAIDWTMANRNIANPDGIDTYEEFVNEQQANGYVEEHDGSTLVSHAGYLIWQDWTKYGDPTDRAYINLLARLYYQALIMSPSDCTLEQHAACVMQAGAVMLRNGEISSTQYAAIERAFETVGITPDAGRTIVCPMDAELTVTDVNGSAYGNYRLTFSSVTADKVPDPVDVVLDEKGAEGKIPLPIDAADFDEGVPYTFTVSDLGGSGAPDVSVTVMFTGSGATGTEDVDEETGRMRIEVQTAFGSSEVPVASKPVADVDQDVVLVLDVSGSMSGEPFESLRQAVDQFIDVAEQNNLTVGIVTFSDDAETLADLTDADYENLRQALGSDGFYSGGSTNVEAGLELARDMLGGADGNARSVVLMTDGQPNVGAEGDELVEVAENLKADGVNLYTLGFFNSLSGTQLAEAQDLLERMATQGEHFEAQADNLVDFFADIAGQLSGQRYTYIRVACPVDVTVVYNGQVLSSSAPDVASNTNFGSISYQHVTDGEEGSDGSDETDQVKIVRLLEGYDYDIYLAGTDRGEMDYSISFMDENGKYGGERTFENVPLTDDTLIQTNSAEADSTTLAVDEDGDGVTDIRYRASAGEEAVRVTREENAGRRTALVAGAVAVLAVGVGALEYRGRKRRAA